MLIPRANVRHLMLAERVRDAVAKQRFHIYPVSTIDEGMSILTGVAAGRLSTKGTYPPGTVNALVMQRLALLTEKAREAKGRKQDS